MVRTVVFIVATFLLFMCSCSIEKRKYLPGFYVGAKPQHPEIVVRNTISTPGESQIKMNIPDESVVFLSGKQNFPPIHSLTPVFSDTVKCDEIILKKGDIITGVVTDIEAEYLWYKQCHNQEGPKVSIRKKDVLMIKYSNGTRMVMDERKANNASQREVTGKDYKTQNDKTSDRAFMIFLFGLLSLIGLVSFMLTLLSPLFAIAALIMGLRLQREPGGNLSFIDQKRIRQGMKMARITLIILVVSLVFLISMGLVPRSLLRKFYSFAYGAKQIYT